MLWQQGFPAGTDFAAAVVEASVNALRHCPKATVGKASKVELSEHKAAGEYLVQFDLTGDLESVVFANPEAEAAERKAAIEKSIEGLSDQDLVALRAAIDARVAEIPVEGVADAVRR